MAKAAAKTGIMPTVLVAIEQGFPTSQRVIDDSLAIRMLPFGARVVVRFLRLPWMRHWLIGLSEKADPGIWGSLLCRKRYIDERVESCRNDTAAVVSLGAGFDTRPFRLPLLADTPTWEIDQPEIIETKQKRLRKAIVQTPKNVKLVAVDFDLEDLGSVLASRGYSAKLRTFFVWEGVTQYLTEQGVRATFDWLAKASPGSRLVFTYVRKGFLTGETLYGWMNGYKRFVATKVWLFGMEPQDCDALLDGYGWRVIEDLDYDQLWGRYIGPTGRSLTSMPVERIVYAEKI